MSSCWVHTTAPEKQLLPCVDSRNTVAKWSSDWGSLLIKKKKKKEKNRFSPSSVVNSFVWNVRTLRKLSAQSHTMNRMHRGKCEQVTSKDDDNDDQHFDYSFKVLLIGDSSVGKTSFLFRFADDSFTSAFVSTVGIDFKVKTVKRREKKVKLQIWVRKLILLALFLCQLSFVRWNSWLLWVSVTFYSSWLTEHFVKCVWHCWMMHF